MKPLAAIRLLYVAQPPGSPLRAALYDELLAVYGDRRRLDQALIRLAELDWIDYGVNAISGWLTKQGAGVLRAWGVDAEYIDPLYIDSLVT